MFAQWLHHPHVTRLQARFAARRPRNARTRARAGEGKEDGRGQDGATARRGGRREGATDTRRPTRAQGLANEGGRTDGGSAEARARRGAGQAAGGRRQRGRRQAATEAAQGRRQRRRRRAGGRRQAATRQAATEAAQGRRQAATGAVALHSRTAARPSLRTLSAPCPLLVRSFRAPRDGVEAAGRYPYEDNLPNLIHRTQKLATVPKNSQLIS